MKRLVAALALVAASALVAACGTAPHAVSVLVDAGDGSDGSTVAPGVSVTAVVDSTQFVVREHLLAAGEMQISGEPLAEIMGRDLGGYSRDELPTNLYNDPVLGFAWIDLAGFATAVESYEYSKQPMNFLAFESGAGTALVHAALGSDVVDRIQQFAGESGALGKWVFPAGTWPANNVQGDINPTGSGSGSGSASAAAGSGAANPLGWPGIWPTVHLFDSFDPTIHPTSNVALSCAISSDDTPAAASTAAPELCGDYECDATTSHLVNRAAQIDPHITPGADGFATWKYGLWTLNYLQVMHDASQTGVASVPASQLGQVGSAGNTIVGDDGDGNATGSGTWLGSSDIEGFQAAMFLLESEARADDWLSRLSTADGSALSGFASIADALAYGETAPLRWFPGSITVTETADPSGFPVPAYSLDSADSHALDLLGLAMGYSELYALTDTGNADVGGAQPAIAYFDGDPFPADDQLPDGEATLHDRALAMIRVAVVDLDRLHVDPATGIIADDVAFTGATPARGTTVSTTTVAYALLGLRTVLRACTSQLELYSNNTPDTMATCILDSLPLGMAGGGSATVFGDRVRQLVLAQAELLYNSLTDATGRAYDGWNLATGAPLDPSDVLDAHTAAVRGLFAAYLATGNAKYRTRAIAVFDRLEATFYQADARIFTETAGSDSVQYTPLRFALLQSSLRDMYELVAAAPGGQARQGEIAGLIARLGKLVLNGWDDRNDDQLVYQPECVQYDGVHAPRGGLQMAERALTGELGRDSDDGMIGPPTIDRDSDCVPEIDDAQLPAALADAMTFTIHRN